MIPIIIAVLSTIAGCAAAVGAWAAVRRTKSGRIETTDADVLWEEGRQMRKDLQDETIRLRAEVAAMRAEVLLLREEMVALRNEAAALRNEAAKLRMAEESCAAELARLRALLFANGIEV